MYLRKIILFSIVLILSGCSSNNKILKLVNDSYSVSFSKNIDCYDYGSALRINSYRKMKNFLFKSDFSNSKIHIVEFFVYDNSDLKYESLILLIYIEGSLKKISFIDSYEKEVELYESNFLGFESEINTSKYIISKSEKNKFSIDDDEFEDFNKHMNNPQKILFTSLNRGKVEFIGCFDGFRVPL